MQRSRLLILAAMEVRYSGLQRRYERVALGGIGTYLVGYGEAIPVVIQPTIWSLATLLRHWDSRSPPWSVLHSTVARVFASARGTALRGLLMEAQRNGSR